MSDEMRCCWCLACETVFPLACKIRLRTLGPAKHLLQCSTHREVGGRVLRACDEIAPQEHGVALLHHGREAWVADREHAGILVHLAAWRRAYGDLRGCAGFSQQILRQLEAASPGRCLAFVFISCAERQQHCLSCVVPQEAQIRLEHTLSPFSTLKGLPSCTGQPRSSICTSLFIMSSRPMVSTITAHSLCVLRMASCRFFSERLWNSSVPHCAGGAVRTVLQALKLAA